MTHSRNTPASVDNQALQQTLGYYGKRILRQAYIPIILLGAAILLASGEMHRRLPVYTTSLTIMINPTAGQSSLFPFALDSSSRDRIVQSYVTYLRLPSFAQLVKQKAQVALSAEEIGRALTVESIPDTFFLRLSAQASDPALAQTIANSAGAVLVESSLNQAQSNPDRDALIERLQSQLEYYEDQVAQLHKQLDELQRKPPGSDEASRERDLQLMIALRGDLTQIEGLIVQLLTSLATLRGQGSTNTATVAIIDPAPLPPPMPAPSPLRFFLFALLGSQTLGIGVIVLIDYLFPRFRGESQAAAILGLPLLGSISERKIRRPAGKLVASESPEAEQYRLLATTLTLRLRGSRAPSLLQVTSAMAREGKSLTVSNLAVALSELGQRVLVVDADLRHPIQHQIFGCANSGGLAASPSSDQPFDTSLIQQTGIARLHLLNAGASPAHPAHFLASAPLRRWIEQLRLGNLDFDVVLFDSPPLLQASDAAILAPQMDAVLLVMDLQHTEQRNARRAHELLMGVEAPVLGLVVNRAPRSSLPAYYRLARG